MGQVSSRNCLGSKGKDWQRRHDGPLCVARAGDDADRQWVRDAPASFPDHASAVVLYRELLAPFGNLSDREWDHLVRHSIGRDPDRRWRALYDPGTAAVFRPVFFYNLSLWSYWDAISCPTLVLRSVESDLLLPSTAREMAKREPKADLVEFAGCPHARALLDREQIDVVADWLERH